MKNQNSDKHFFTKATAKDGRVPSSFPQTHMRTGCLSQSLLMVVTPAESAVYLQPRVRRDGGKILPPYKENTQSVYF